MLKVVHVTTVHPATDNRIFHKECLTLRAAGYQVTLVAPHGGDELIDNIQIRALPAARNRWDRASRLTRLALAICRREDADIYHFHDPELMPSMARLARAGKPVIYDMHENIVKDMRTKPHVSPPLRPVLSTYLRLRMKDWLMGMHVIFAERSYQPDYRWIEQYTVIENMPRTAQLLGVEVHYGSKPALAYLGSITPRRGSLTMLEVVRQLQLQGRQVGLECVGPATALHRREMELLVQASELKQVRLQGRLEPAEAWNTIAGCLAGMALLADTPNYRDSLPTKLFEYMGLGLPVVASDFPLYRDIIDRHQCGICVNPADLPAVHSAVEHLLDNPAEAAMMGQRGREAVRQNYTWDTEAKKLLDLYKSLLGRSPTA
jgi:glycosyltransferase involved in cell wall biosynthesis